MTFFESSAKAFQKANQREQKTFASKKRGPATSATLLGRLEFLEDFLGILEISPGPTCPCTWPSQSRLGVGFPEKGPRAVQLGQHCRISICRIFCQMFG